MDMFDRIHEMEVRRDKVKLGVDQNGSMPNMIEES